MTDDDFKHDWMIKASTLGVTTRIYFRCSQSKAEAKLRKKQKSFRGSKVSKVTLYMLTLWPIEEN